MKSVEEIEAMVKSYIDHAYEDLSKENPKFDFKRKWPNLKDEKDINEFLKDTTAMVNTVGLDGVIVYGYDEKDKFIGAKFTDSGLRDSNELLNLIASRIERPFNINTWDIVINGYPISIIQIPPSLDKPHLITSYKKYSGDKPPVEEKNKIFVRRNTSCYPPTKYELDFMYYDRKNIIPDYELRINVNWNQSSFTTNPGKKKLLFDFEADFENLGLRPVAINNLEIGFNIPDYFKNDKLIFDSQIILGPNRLIIESGKLCSKKIRFYSAINLDSTTFNLDHDYILENLNNNRYKVQNITTKVFLSNGKIFNAKID